MVTAAVAPSGDPGEEIHLALLAFLHDADRAFVISEIGRRQFFGISFPVTGQDREQKIDIVRRRVDQQIHIFRQTHISLQCDRYASDDDEAHAAVSEQHQQFFERGFHRWPGVPTCRPGS